MARITVEDCVSQIPNRFDLVLAAAARARALSSGAALTVDRDRDKNPVVALREIAEQNIDLGALRETMVRNLQKYSESEPYSEEPVSTLDSYTTLAEDDVRDSLRVVDVDAAESDSEEGDDEEEALLADEDSQEIS